MLFVLCLKRFRWLAYACLGGRLALRPSQPPLIASFCADYLPAGWGLHPWSQGAPERLATRWRQSISPNTLQLWNDPKSPDWKGRILSCDFLVDVLYSFIFFFLILCPSTVTNGTSHSPTALNGAPSPPNGFSNGPSSSSSSSLANQQLPPACGARQLSKLKRFLTTLQQFGNDISPEIGERDRTLVLGLVVSQLNAAQLGGREKVGETPSTGCVLAALLFPHWVLHASLIL